MKEEKDFDVSFNTTLSDGKGGGCINVVSKKKLSQTPENYAKLRILQLHCDGAGLAETNCSPHNINSENNVLYACMLLVSSRARVTSVDFQ